MCLGSNFWAVPCYYQVQYSTVRVRSLARRCKRLHACKTTCVGLVQAVRSCRRARLSHPACCLSRAETCDPDPAWWRPALRARQWTVAGCRRAAPACTAQHNSHNAPPKNVNAPPRQRRDVRIDAQQSTAERACALAGPPASRVEQVGSAWQCALCDVLMCCWRRGNLQITVASLAKCRLCPCYPLPR